MKGRPTLPTTAPNKALHLNASCKWFPGQDSNLDFQSQNLTAYRLADPGMAQRDGVEPPTPWASTRRSTAELPLHGHRGRSRTGVRGFAVPRIATLPPGDGVQGKSRTFGMVKPQRGYSPLPPPTRLPALIFAYV